MAAAFNIPAPRKAEKKKVKLKMAVQGPSGSGKTWGALSLATNLWPNAKICVVDTENGSAELYADRFTFDTIPLAPPFHTDRYIACIDAAVKHGYDVLIIDQISHQWDGEGGILRRKEELDRRPGANSFNNWAHFTPEHERFKSAIVQAPIHIIATMRQKQDYVLVVNDKGKQQPQKMGMAPIQRDGFDYEFTLVFDVQMDHRATAGKDRTALFSEQVVDLSSPKIAESLREWMANGAEVKQEAGPTLVQPSATVQPPPGQPSALPWSYNLGQLVCFPLNVQPRTTKNSEPYRVVKLNGKCEGKELAFCFHASLFEAIDYSKERRAQFQVEMSGDYLNIVDVVAIDDVDYRGGKPYQEPEPQPPAAERINGNPEITDDDIPF
jgi:AAA domain